MKKNIAPFAVQTKNATSVNILRSYLKAVGISTNQPQVDGCDLSVECRLGGTLEVQVAISAICDPPESSIRVMAKDFTGRRIQTALDAFYSVTDAAGYDRRDPLGRGKEGALNAKGNLRKLHYKDEPFLVAVRHTEFRRSPNPSADRWKLYRATMEKTAWAFMRLNYELCLRHGLTVDDLLTYARCYVVNFCARYETPTPKFHDNERKCYVYIQQRFNNDLRPGLLKQERSALPDAETVSVALYGVPDADIEVSPEPGTDVVDFDYIARHCELDVSSPEARQTSAGSKLDELLTQMPHDQMIEVLTAAASNKGLDLMTRREATRRLRAHTTGPVPFVPEDSADDAGIEEDEDLAGEDTLGTTE